LRAINQTLFDGGGTVPDFTGGYFLNIKRRSVLTDKGFEQLVGIF